MSAAQVIEMPATELMQRATGWPARARSLAIDSQEALELAADELAAVKALLSEVDATFDPIVKKAFETHKEAVAQKKRHRQPLEEAELIFKGAIAGYHSRQGLLRLQEQKRLEEEARARQAEELEREIEQAEAEGASSAEVAAIIQREEARPPAPVVAPQTVRPVAGVSMREMWAAEVTNLLSLVRYVANNPQFVGLLTPNMTAINGMARSLKTAMRIPGVRAYSTTGVASRRA
jgi:hypothetical protein